MTTYQLYDFLKEQFSELLKAHQLEAAEIQINARGMTPEEAIGHTARTDFPILTGREVMLIADFRGAKGQAFTDAPAQFSGTVQEVLAMDLNCDSYARGLFIATLNAVMRYLKLSENSVHCKNQGPELCAQHMVDWVRKNYGAPRIALVGFQPALIGALSQAFQLQVLDLNPENIGKMKDGCRVRDGEADREAVVSWADLILCTGSTLCNGTIVQYMDLAKPVAFFGTTLSGAAPLLGLRRACFADLTYAEQSEV